MSLDAAWIKDAAAAQGWVAMDTEFAPKYPFEPNATMSMFSWLGELFSFTPDYFRRRPPDSSGVPANRDWRELNSCITAPLNQRDINACASFATCSVGDARARIAGLHPGQSAPLFHYFCTLGRTITSGADFDWIAEMTLQKGLPYAISASDSLRDKDACPALGAPQTLEVSAFYSFKTVEEVKREIAKHGPVMANMDLREDFHKWYRSGIYKPTGLQIRSLHAVCLIGYDDKAGCWIGKNSLGTEWGEGGGFFRIAYGAAGILTNGEPVYSLDLA
jgi:hypothetical protein